MKRIALVLVILIGGFVHAQNVSLQVKMSGFENNTGVVKVGLYDSEFSFLKTVYKNLKGEIKSGSATVMFNDVPKGTYAVSVYHDENENGVLDKNSFGIPSEDYGTSNDAKGFMGPPKFEDAKFIVDKNTIIYIKLNN